MLRKLIIYLISLSILSFSNAFAGQVFVCKAKKHTAIVTLLPSGEYRYTAWKKPRKVTSEPDMVVFGGEEKLDGSGQCGYSTWSFKNSNVEYVVSTLGCSEDQPPAHATGTLSVYINDAHKQTWWCFE